MLDIRFAGATRFMVGAGDWLTPDNVDAPPVSEAMAGAQLPEFPVQGIHWTRHERPRTPARPRSRAHLRIIK